MLNVLFSSPLAFLLLAFALVISLTIHEFAHAWVADRLGDPTPRSQGRVTLNPLAHLDPLGTLMLFFAGFGWGKPVQFDPYNLRNQQRDTMLIALAGPASNIILAFLVALALPVLPFASVIWMVIITINIALATFNLLPIHPLDGSKILSGLLPIQYAREYNDVMQRYGFIILLALIFLPVDGGSPIDYLIRPLMDGFLAGIFAVTQFIQASLGI